MFPKRRGRYGNQFTPTPTMAKARRRSSGANGSLRQVPAPLCMLFFPVAPSYQPVIAMTLVEEVSGEDLIRLHTSKPSSPGRRISRKTTLGRNVPI